jgi:archaemetzincin
MGRQALAAWWERHQRAVLGLLVGALIILAGAWIAPEVVRIWAVKSCASTITDDEAAAAEGLSAYWEAGEDFEPLSSAQPGGWRSRFDEPVQCFDDWLDADPEQPDEKRGVLYIQPIGEFDAASPDLEVLVEFVEAYFDLPVRVRPTLDIETLEVARRENENTQQPQWLTGDLLDALQERLPGDAYAMIGLTMTDVWPGKGWNFVFGQARVGERVGVYSLARYGADDEQLTLLRGMKVMTHELGHLFGISHCLHYRCNMNGSNSLKETDAHPIHLCPVDLKKLHHAVGFDPQKRYLALADFYTRHGFDEQAEFARRRAARP